MATPYATSLPLPPKYVPYTGVYSWVLPVVGCSLAIHASRPPPGAEWNAFTIHVPGTISVKSVPPARYTLKLGSTATAPPVPVPFEGVLPPT